MKRFSVRFRIGGGGCLLLVKGGCLGAQRHGSTYHCHCLCPCATVTKRWLLVLIAGLHPSYLQYHVYRAPGRCFFLFQSLAYFSLPSRIVRQVARTNTNNVFRNNVYPGDVRVTCTSRRATAAPCVRNLLQRHPLYSIAVAAWPWVVWRCCPC